jgi:translocation and assembly module TamA
MRTRTIILLSLLPAMVHAELQVSGVDGDLEKNVRAHVGLDTEPCDAEPWLIRRRFRAAESEARTALEPYGYYSPTITSALSADADCWHASLQIDPGAGVRIRQLNLSISGEARIDPVISALVVPPTLRIGARLRHADYEAYKQAVQIRALERGYIEAAYTESRIDVWPEERAADITLDFDSGPRYSFGEIHQQQDFLEPRIVSRLLDLHPGTPYDSKDIGRAYLDLSSSGYFRRIDIEPAFDAAVDRQIPINVRLEPVERIEYTIGAGYSTDTRLRLRAGFRNQRINERGHRFNTQLRLSPVLSGLASEYRIPLDDPRSDWLSYTAALEVEDTDTFQSDTARVGMRRSKQLNSSWMRTYALDVAYDRYEVGDTEDSSLLVMPGIKFDHKRGDRQLYANNGRSISLESRGTDQSLGSNTSFLQFIARTRWILPAGNNARLLSRLTAGATFKSDIDELPPSVRFFAGGDQSIRGYAYESLGPENEDGDVIGGSNLLTASVEYEHKLLGNYYWAAFVDAGNAFDGSSFDVFVGAGVGLKWRSPVGPIRVYVAEPLSIDDKSVRFHISFGVEL